MTEIRLDLAGLSGRVKNLPTLPEVVQEVSRLIDDPMATAEDVEEIVSRDPILVAKILQMVNSAFYGLTEPVMQVDQAVMILGFKTVRAITLSIGVISLFQEQQAGYSLRRHWLHSSAIACISRSLAKEAEMPDPDVAYVAGILKHIGMLVMMQYAPDETRAAVALARKHDLPLDKSLNKIFATSSAEVGAWLLQEWQMEPQVCDAVRYQNDLNLAPDTQLVSVGQLSEYLCNIMKIRLPGDHGDQALNNDVWRYLGLDRSSLADALERLNDEVTQAKQLLSIAS
jgi:HD-like signal output (HDOD) protein